MTIKGFFHVCMINDYLEIVKEQLKLIIRSGLYDRLQCLNIGCVGEAVELNKLKKLISQYEKIQIKAYSVKLTDYEFITLAYLWDKANKSNNFYGFYIHTKGVSWPNHEGGKHWRDYMNYYNLSKWKDCVKKLNEGYDTCGVKFLKQNNTLRTAHYSGNFYWFKSQYVKKLKDPLKLNLKDRFDAEMWIGLGNPQPASLCQMFVDYNTKGKFQIPKNQIQETMRKIIVHTLAYNLPCEVEKTTQLIYDQNHGVEFKHYICDLGFPIDKGNEVPKDVKKSQAINTKKLKDICKRYGSTYIEMPNIGVSQNWTQIIKHCNLADEDVIIGADPDERPLNQNWIKAMAAGLSQPQVGMVTLMMPEQAAKISTYRFKDCSVNGTKLIEIMGGMNWAMIGFNGKFCKAMGEVPYPKTHKIYGYIEHFVDEALKKHNFRSLFLPEHRVYHSDYERGDEGSPRLLREWKNQIIHKHAQYGQMDFIKYLDMVRVKQINIPVTDNKLQGKIVIL